MNKKIQKSIIAGIAGTAAMTMVMFVAPYMGMPKMSAATMLSEMLGSPVLMGWIMHFMIGVIFAAFYVFIINRLLRKIQNTILKGAIFGLIVFIIAQIVMAMMSAIFTKMPSPEGTMVLMMMGSIIGHIIYGITVSLTAKD